MGDHLHKLQKKDVQVDNVSNFLDKLSLNSGSNSDEQETEPENLSEDSAGLPLESDAHEIIAYSAKLYRFDKATNKWNERGLGQMRIFEMALPKDRVQVVMWVNGTRRLVCNFRSGSNMNIRKDPVKPNTATWTTYDFSEKKFGKQEIFCCKFRTEDECDDFIAKLTHPENQPPPTNASKTETEESSVDCTGCIGCDPDNFNFPTIKAIIKVETVIESRLESDSCADSPSMVKPALFN